MRRILGSVFVFATALAACAPATEEDLFEMDGADEVQGVASLTFNADGTVTQSGTLTAGSRVRVRYAQSRLSACRGNSNGRVAWTVTGYASVNGAAATSFETATVSSDGLRRVATSAYVQLPAAGELQLWFHNTNRWGCSAYDSRDGRNYRYAIRAAEGATAESPSIVFRAGGEVAQTGRLVAGSRVRVRYEPDRLTSCRGTTSGNAAWNITGYARVNGAAAVTFETTQAAANATRVAIDATVQVPAAGELQLWFHNTNRWGCSAYDSRDGQNYRFPVASR